MKLQPKRSPTKADQKTDARFNRWKELFRPRPDEYIALFEHSMRGAFPCASMDIVSEKGEQRLSWDVTIMIICEVPEADASILAVELGYKATATCQHIQRKYEIDGAQRAKRARG